MTLLKEFTKQDVEKRLFKRKYSLYKQQEELSSLELSGIQQLSLNTPVSALLTPRDNRTNSITKRGVFDFSETEENRNARNKICGREESRKGKLRKTKTSSEQTEVQEINTTFSSMKDKNPF